MSKFHMPHPFPSFMWCLDSMSKWTTSHPILIKKHLQISCDTDGEMSGWSWLAPGEYFHFWLLCWDEFWKNAYLSLCNISLLHFMNSKFFFKLIIYFLG